MQQHLGLVAEFTDAGGDIGALAQRVFQHRVRDSSHDRVCVRIAVARNIDGFHASSEKIPRLHTIWSDRARERVCVFLF